MLIISTILFIIVNRPYNKVDDNNNNKHFYNRIHINNYY